MFLLSQDDFFLDIDPSKSPIRFPAKERARRFGSDPNSASYKERLARHRESVVSKLVVVGQRFIRAILRAMPCFPPSLRYLVETLSRALASAKGIPNEGSNEEVALVCTDLVFTNFLCAAIINPEPLGIISGRSLCLLLHYLINLPLSDTPIGHIARFNLMQIGQILQVPLWDTSRPYLRCNNIDCIVDHLGTGSAPL